MHKTQNYGNSDMNTGLVLSVKTRLWFSLTSLSTAELMGNMRCEWMFKLIAILDVRNDLDRQE